MKKLIKMFLTAYNDILVKMRLIFSDLEKRLFHDPKLENLALFRLIFCGTLFYIACWRQLNVDQFGPDSLVPREQAFGLYFDYYKPYLQLFFWPDKYAKIVHGLYIGLLGLATIGLSNRFLMILTWVIAQGFIQRNFSVLFGADVIGNLFLFYLSFSRCHDYFSIKSLLLKKNPIKTYSQNSFLDLLSSVSMRLLQFQLMTIYAYTGFEKLKGLTWWDGTALWTVLVNPQFTSYDLMFLRNIPIFFAIGTFITIVFEVYFPVMVINKKTRYLWLLVGVFFHLMIGILLDLMPFSLVMMSTYILFVDQNTISNILAKADKYLKRH